MKASRYSAPALLGGLVLAFASFNAALAQDSAFLACEQYRDRGQRIACLEDALEAATAAEAAPTATAPESPARTVSPAAAATPPPPPTAAPAPAAATAAEPAEEENGPSLLDRLRNFGRDETATVSTDADGQDQLHDTITKLEKRREMWIVTLASGQVWMQDYPRVLALREGDAVTIYQAGIGNGYRLTTERLSGFIRVKRTL
jgi:hypothetical protein